MGHFGALEDTKDGEVDLRVSATSQYLTLHCPLSVELGTLRLSGPFGWGRLGRLGAVKRYCSCGMCGAL